MVIGQCKKLARVRHPGGVRALYKQLFPPKHHSEPCFWSVPTQLPPSLGLHPEQRLRIKEMAAKDVPVIDLIEEEEEEWPEAGAQNVEEAEQYVDHINNIFDHLSTLIHEDTKDALGQTIRNFKKIVTRQWEMMGDADIDVVLCTIKGPHCSVSMSATPHKRGSQSGGSPRRNTDRPRIHQTATQRGPDGQKRLPSSAISFQHAAQAHEHLSEVCANVSVHGQGDGQGHPAVHHKWSRMTTGPAKHTRGVSQPSGR